jgi:hypothetical protein
MCPVFSEIVSILDNWILSALDWKQAEQLTSVNVKSESFADENKRWDNFQQNLKEFFELQDTKVDLETL